MQKADFAELLSVLARHQVRFVVVGGVSGVLQGAPISTFDLDIVHARSANNVVRLLEALDDLDAIYREASWRKLRPRAEHLLGPGHHLLITRAGPLDVLGEIVGGRNYATLAQQSIQIDLTPDVAVDVVDLEVLIATKEELGRERDRAWLPILRRALEERDS